MQKIRTRVSEKWLNEQGILCIRYIAGATVDLRAIKESRDENLQLLGDRKELVLCDARVPFTVTPDAQKYAIREIVNKSRIATAVITNKAYVQMIVNFALRFSGLRSSVRMFRREDEALKWLDGFRTN